ncbi:MAG: SDR family oxidoreductase [Acidimicrobiales bacterium]
MGEPERAGSSDDVAGRRVVVAGASAGIGRATAVALSASGVDVAALARRPDVLDEVVVQAAADGHPGAIVAIACDVRDDVTCRAAVATAADRLGGIDAVVYATGVNHLAPLAETTTDDWRRLFETNVVGAASVVAGALPALRVSGGRVALLSSDSVADPWPGLGAYAATKAALETVTAAWRAEEPDVTFSRVVVGPTITGMAEAWDPERSVAMFERWHAEGRFEGVDPQPPEVVAAELVRWVAAARPPEELDLQWLARPSEASGG